MKGEILFDSTPPAPVRRITMKLYICITRDKYELPVAVAESARELAEMRGVQSSTVLSSISHEKEGLYKSMYKLVEVEDD